MFWRKISLNRDREMKPLWQWRNKIIHNLASILFSFPFVNFYFPNLQPKWNVPKAQKIDKKKKKEKLYPLKRSSNKRTKIDFMDRSIDDKTSVPATFNVVDGIDLSCTGRHRSLFTGRNSVKLCRKAVFRQMELSVFASSPALCRTGKVRSFRCAA